jgi:heterodisulfide reductase subunit A-like polyferredoxin
MLNITGKDAPRLSENIMREYSLDYCVVTLGEKGAFALSRKGEGACVPVCPEQAIDIEGYTNEQIKSMIDALVKEVA